MPKSLGEKQARKRQKLAKKERDREQKNGSTFASTAALSVRVKQSPDLQKTVSRAHGRILDFIRQARVLDAAQSAQMNLLPLGQCLAVKEYTTLLAAMSPKCCVAEFVQLIEVIAPLVRFSSRAVERYVTRFCKWCVMEHLAECQSNLQRIATVPAHALEQVGVCVSAMQVRRGKGGVELELLGSLPFGHNFQKGDTVLTTFSNTRESSGCVDRSDAEILQVLPGGQGLKVKLTTITCEQISAKDLVRCTCRVDRLSNHVTYARVLDALRGLDSDGVLDQVRKLLTVGFGEDEQPTMICGQMMTPRSSASEAQLCDEVVDRMPQQVMSSPLWSTANASQQQALSSGFQRRLALIQGPPGSGKTRTSVMLVQLWVQTGHRPILCTADSNVAVDNLVSGCAAVGLGVARIGRPEAIRPDLEQYSLENIARAKLGLADRGGERGREAADRHWKMEQNILRGVQVVCATCSGAASAVLDDQAFQIVLIDEAAQVTEPMTLLPLVHKGMRRAVLVGDHRQLPPVVICREAELEGLGVPLFERLVTRGVAPTMLSVQYRMHPALAAYPSGHFYGGELQTGVSSEQRPIPGGFAWPVPDVPIAFVPVDGAEMAEGSSQSNTAEVNMVARIVEGFLGQGGLTAEHVAVISPYAAQVRLLRRRLGGCRLGMGAALAAASEAGRGPRSLGLEVGSVDSFQGREKEVIVISTVRANASGNVGFLSDPRRLNVAMTRARRGLVVCGEYRTLRCDAQCWSPWLSWAEACGLVVGRPPTASAVSDAQAAVAGAFSSAAEPPATDSVGWCPPAADASSEPQASVVGACTSAAHPLTAAADRLPRSWEQSHTGNDVPPSLPGLADTGWVDPSVAPTEDWWAMDDQQVAQAMGLNMDSGADSAVPAASPPVASPLVERSPPDSTPGPAGNFFGAKPVGIQPPTAARTGTARSSLPVLTAARNGQAAAAGACAPRMLGPSEAAGAICRGLPVLGARPGSGAHGGAAATPGLVQSPQASGPLKRRSAADEAGFLEDQPALKSARV